MQIDSATINVKNLRLRTFIGFNPEEREKKQDVIINIKINYAIDNAVLEDQLDSVLDYKHITKEVIEHVETGRFLLLEKLVADVLHICSRHPTVNHAHVVIDKPHALRFSDSVSVALDYVAEKVNTLKLVENAS